ncbi:MAG TPA: glycosyltransferase family 2 protein [Bryobacteraceae bacterium]|nr:glycosyltransferase family 2 protein [Bryobacteraceae bacterium]
MRADLVLWISIATVIYTYAGYPLTLLALRMFVRRPIRRAQISPSVSLLIPAYNESRVIERKIQNALALDYPEERLEIVVASDGSADDTVAIAQRFADGRRVRVLAFPRNRGKMATLNASVPQLGGDIVVFSDATALLYPDALRQLVQSLADPDVAAVSGRYTVIKAGDVCTGASEDLYWKYETSLKILESDVASTVGAHGHLYAIRRELYPYPPDAIINDDYVIFSSVLAEGYRAVYEPAATVYEEAREMTGFGRRIRIVAGNIQQLREMARLLHPLRPLPLFFFVSHKLARLLVPLAMLAALIANLFLLDGPFYRGTIFAQAAFYLLAACGALWRLRPKILMLPFYFSMINAAAFLGFYHALTRRRGMAWE